MKNVGVSTCIITYNQEDFIAECIENAINQKVEFNYEIIIGDDNSTDQTSKICKEYAKKYPNLIKFYQREKNLGMIGNWIETLKECEGKYIAVCEGDDYWTDPLKLQKQVDFLEANDDYGICFHKVKLYNENDNEFMNDTITKNVNETTCALDLAKGNFIHTPSVLFRNSFTIPEWYFKSPIGDWPLYMIAIKDKKIKRLESVMAVYRMHESGIWSKKTKEYRILNTLKAYELVYNSNEINIGIKKELKKTIKNLKNQIKKKDSKFVMVLKKIKKKLFL